MSVEVGQDLFPMVKLSKDGDRIVADPVLKRVAKVGLTQKDVEDVVAAATVLAKAS